MDASDKIALVDRFRKAEQRLNRMEEGRSAEPSESGFECAMLYHYSDEAWVKAKEEWLSAFGGLFLYWSDGL